MIFLALFFAAALLCNSIPHVTSALQGRAFPTPFAKPRGVGMSSPRVNLVWGAVNFFAGLFLLSRHPPAFGLNAGSAALVAGALTAGLYLAHHFGNVRRARPAE